MKNLKHKKVNTRIVVVSRFAVALLYKKLLICLGTRQIKICFASAIQSLLFLVCRS